MTYLARYRGASPAWRRGVAFAFCASALVPACRDDDDGPPAADSTGGASDSDSTATTVIEPGTDSTAGQLTGTDSDSTTGEGVTDTEDPTSGETTEGTGCGDGIPETGELCFAMSQPLSDAPTGTLVLGDLDGDANLDIVAGQLGGVSVFLGNGDGTFAAPMEIATPSGVLGVALANFDGDDALDLAVANTGDDTLGIHFGAGDGTFGAPTLYPVGDSPRGIATGDFNGDGAIDVAVTNEGDGTVSIAQNDGGGTLSLAATIAVGTVPTAAIGVELDADVTDLAVVDFGGGSISVLLGSPVGLGTPDAYTTGVAPRGLIAADFDGNGTTDLATPNQINNNFAILLGSGTGMLAAPQFFPTDQSPREGAVGDFDGDGEIDVALAQEGANAIGILRSDSPGELSFEIGEPVPTLSRPIAVAVGDLDGDDVDDIVAGSIEAGGGIAIVLADP